MDESKLPAHVRSAVYPDGSVEAVDESGGRPVKRTLAKLLSRMETSSIAEVAIDCEWSFKERKPSEKSSHMAWPWTPGAELYSIAISGRSEKGNVVSDRGAGQRGADAQHDAAEREQGHREHERLAEPLEEFPECGLGLLHVYGTFEPGGTDPGARRGEGTTGGRAA